ncbi:MAG: tetratricopeptide repeat protein [Bacteroidota bacterium]
MINNKLYTKAVNIAFLALLIVTLVACSAKRNTFTSRAYHNLTARYNAYFNGKESFKEAIIATDKSYKDNFNTILPIFKFTDNESSKGVFPQCDRAITKAGIVIQNHSMFIKGKEHNNWVDDSYLLMGNSNFFKREFFTANQIYQFIINQYPDKLGRYEAMLWLANSYIQMNKNSEAQGIFNLLNDTKSKDEMPKYLYKWILLSQAQLNINTKNYSRALEPIKLALELNNRERFISKDKAKEHLFFKYKFSKKRKARITFILAQLNEKIEEFDEASMLYGKVLKMNPTYEMAFYAKINRAKLFNVKAGNADKIISDLKKMAKDGKNVDYLDQIYFALAELALKANNFNQGVSYLKLSASKSTINTYQKAISFLRLANLYFEKPEYEFAQQYYDSTMTVLPKDYPDYSVYSDRKDVLSNLVLNLNTIAREDSLQRLAKMTAAERDEVISGIIKKIIEAEELKQLQDMQAQQLLNNMPQNNNVASTGGAGNWYFDNPSAISFGKQEFAKKFGNRKLEDNWRRFSKEVIVDFGTVDNNQVDSLASTASAATVDPKDKNTYLKNIPLTKEMMFESTEKIKEAYYNAGVIFRQDLNDLPKSNQTFETLLTRFPDNKFLLETYYKLYSNNNELKNTPKSDIYKNIIISKYPESDYAKMLINPEAFKQSKEKEDNETKLYAQTYLAYNQGNYALVIANKDLATTTYPGSKLLAKFNYLNALSVGRTKDTASFRVELENFIGKFSGSDEAKDAQIILNYMKAPLVSAASSDPSKPAKQKQLYTYNEASIHFYALVVPIMDMDVNKLKVALSDFNAKFFSLDDLQVNAVYFDDKHQIINISNFKGADKALTYYKTFEKQDILSKLAKTSQYYQFVISTDNYTRLYKAKDVDNYMEFYKENYK